MGAWDAVRMIYEFGEFDLDLRQFQLRRDGEVVPVEPKVFDVLRYLVEHRDRVVAKAELLAEVWPNDIVTDAVLPNNVAVVRKALGQKRRQKVPIETIHGRGYRFCAPVVVRSHGAAMTEHGALGAAAGGGNDPFVARGALMARLASLKKTAAAGKGRVVLLSGDAGMGKTRLLDELRANAGASVGVHVARCLPQSGPQHGVPALWPWIQLLRSCGSSAASDEPGEAAAGGGGGSGLLALLLGASTPGGAAPDFSVLDGVVRFFMSAAERRPLLLLIDDLHLADTASVQVLNLLAQEVLDAQLLVVVTLREGELPPGDATREALVALARPRSVERVQLTALDEQDVDEYVRAALGPELPETLPAQVFEVTLGTPMYVRDAVEGLLDTAGSFDHACYLEHGVRLSPAAYDYARQRVDRLTAPVIETLRAASVMGVRFRLQVLSHLVDDAHDLLDQMDAACDAGIVESEPALADGYAFKHPFLRAAIYHGLPAGQRVRMHRRTADTLAGITDPDHLMLCAIAEHYHRSLPGHDPEPAIEYACRAGRDATYSQDYPLAVRMYGLALEAVAFAPSSEPRRRARILRWLVGSNLDAGQMHEARYLSNDLLEMTRRNGLHEEFAAAVQVIASQERFDAGRGAYPVRLLDEALSHLAEGSSYRPRLLVERARCRDLTRERRAELLDEAQALLVDDIPTALNCQSARVEVLTGPDNVDALLHAADAAVACWPEQAAKLDLLFDPVQRRASLRALWIVRYSVQRSRCFALLTKGDVASADRADDACKEVADRSGWSLARFECGLYRIGRLLADADVDAAAQAIQELFAVSKMLTRADATVALVVLREEMCAIGGKPSMVTEKLLASLARDVPGIRGETVIGTAYMAVRCGYRALGERIFTSLERDRFRDLPQGTPRLAAMYELATVCASLGATSAAETLLDMLRPYAQLCAVGRSGVILGPMGGPLSRLCTVLGRHDDAVAYAQSAASAARAMGMTTPVVQSGLGLCAAWMARAGQGDETAAVSELALVEQLAGGHGLTGIVAEAEAMRGRLTGKMGTQA